MDAVCCVSSPVTDHQIHDNTTIAVLMQRIARRPFTFSDGTYIPQGTYICAATAAHTNGESYSNPHDFEPFRFVDKTRKENAGCKVDMVSTHADFFAFGHGRHACPGRFFAASELKMMLAHIVMTYDVKFDGDGGRPKDAWFIMSCIPNLEAEVLFRKRRA